MEDFKRDLLELDSLQIIRKHIFNGQSKVLSGNQYYQLKEAICSHFHIEFNDIVLVGSGKLGFSIKPNRRYGEFNDNSDIDVAVVSTSLFQKVWKEAYIYKKKGAYWTKSDDFFRYLSEGWIRPDKLPSSNYFEFAGFWWKFFSDLTTSEKYGPYKIRGGLYYSWFFLEEYQRICVEQCALEVKK